MSNGPSSSIELVGFSTPTRFWLFFAAQDIFVAQLEAKYILSFIWKKEVLTNMKIRFLEITLLLRRNVNINSIFVYSFMFYERIKRSTVGLIFYRIHFKHVLCKLKPIFNHETHFVYHLRNKLLFSTRTSVHLFKLYSFLEKKCWH